MPGSENPEEKVPGTQNPWKNWVLVALMLAPTRALAFTDGLCNLDEEYCGRRGSSSSMSGGPTSSSRVQVNPSAVPTEKMLGFEVIGYKGEGDFGIVRGFGRVGAAITPSNSEETFFGAPSAETSDYYLARKVAAQKYQQQKFTLATAFNLIEKGSGLRQMILNLGVMARYNSLTKATTPGAGLSGIFGPFSFGYSVSRDETQLPVAVAGEDTSKVQSILETYSLGLYLNALILDYSTIRTQNSELLVVNLFTTTLLVKKFILSAARRVETSSRPGFNFRTKSLESEFEKVEYFYGIQYQATKNLMVGALYNYYLLREASVTATLMF